MSRTVPIDNNFGAILTCAVRYAIGRRSYMPGLVIDYITPLLSSLDDRTLHAMDRDIDDHERMGDLGDPAIDAPGWKNFHKRIVSEIASRQDPSDKPTYIGENLVITTGTITAEDLRIAGVDADKFDFKIL